MEFIRRNQGVWAVLAILSVLILVLFTFFGGAEEEEVAMRGKVEPRRMYLSFNMEYPIGAMYANVGDEVHRGDVLGVLQMDDLTSQAEAAKNSIAHYEEEMKDPNVGTAIFSRSISPAGLNNSSFLIRFQSPVLR